MTETLYLSRDGKKAYLVPTAAPLAPGLLPLIAADTGAEIYVDAQAASRFAADKKAVERYGQALSQHAAELLDQTLSAAQAALASLSELPEAERPHGPLALHNFLLDQLTYKLPDDQASMIRQSLLFVAEVPQAVDADSLSAALTAQLQSPARPAIAAFRRLASGGDVPRLAAQLRQVIEESERLQDEATSVVSVASESEKPETSSDTYDSLPAALTLNVNYILGAFDDDP